MPLHFSIRHRHLEVTKMLMDYRADVDSKSKFGLTSLHLAAQSNHLDVVKVLLEHKAHIDARDHSKLTPLYYAARNGHLKVVKAFLDARTVKRARVRSVWGAIKMCLKHDSINCINNCEFTPLHCAAQAGHLEIVVALLVSGANKNAKAVGRRTPFYVAACCEHLEIVQELLIRGADVNPGSFKDGCRCITLPIKAIWKLLERS
jgi:hypothetical protein